MSTAKPLIALIADTQLYKELYGLDATRQDWFDAFHSAVQSIKARADQTAAVLILGDVMDKEEVGSRAAYFLMHELKELEAFGIPIGIILGNHDNLADVFSSGNAVNWVKVCQQANDHVVELSLTKPLQLAGCKEYGPLDIYGSHHQSRADITRELRDMAPPTPPKDGNIWLCLHQSLKELSAHVSAWEVSVTDVPKWADRIFLGDFHDFLACKDGWGRDFTYPGSTETVSFNQTKTPGFIFFDRVSKTIEHVPTQQREYITFRLADTPREQWATLLTSRLQQSAKQFTKLPVARVFYATGDWEAWALLEPKVSPLCLRLTAQPIEEAAVAESTTALAVPQSREDVKRMAQDLLTEANGDVLAQDCLAILNDPSNLKQIRTQRFAQALNRPVAATPTTKTNGQTTLTLV